MPKRPKTLRVRLPPYRTPRNAWRRDIHRVVMERLARSRVAYEPEDRLSVEVRLYLDEIKIRFHDVDNRLKDVLDALQGRVGGSTRALDASIPNDKQIFRAIVEKALPPDQSHGLGHLTIRRMERESNAESRSRGASKLLGET